MNNNIFFTFLSFFTKLSFPVELSKPIYLIIIFLGFLIGNLLGLLTKTLFVTIQLKILVFLFLFELISILKYARLFTKISLVKPIKLTNLFKNGILIGIFLEAFKVGS